MLGQIKKSYSFESVNHIQFEKIEARFIKMCKNTKRFNGSLIRTKTIKVGNGKIFEIYNAKTGNKIRDIFLLSDRNGWELSAQDYFA